MDKELDTWITQKTGRKLRHILDLIELLWNLQRTDVKTAQRRGKLYIDPPNTEYRHIYSMKRKKNLLIRRLLPDDTLPIKRAALRMDPKDFQMRVLPITPVLEKPIVFCPVPLTHTQYTFLQHVDEIPLTDFTAQIYTELAREVYTKYG
jgi:hypothetical protein